METVPWWRTAKQRGLRTPNYESLRHAVTKAVTKVIATPCPPRYPRRFPSGGFMRRFLSLSLLACAITISLPRAQAASPNTACIDCHSKQTPNIVSDWKLSKHSQLEVTCATCHGDQHQSAADVAKVKIPTPDTCAQCHQTQVEQYKHGKHSKAWAAMMAMPTIHKSRCR